MDQRIRLNDTIATYLHKHKNGEVSLKIKVKAEDITSEIYEWLHGKWNDGTPLEVLITEFQDESNL